MKALILLSFVTMMLSVNAGCSEEDICSLPIVTGPCKAAFKRWAFDSYEGVCKKFIYGGCKGNENNFETKEECQKSCVCSLPADTGPCTGAILRWAYDSDKNKCKKFSYGGCDGNGNNFESKKECVNACVKPVEVDCYAEPDGGPCYGNFLRYYYDPYDGFCWSFTYGGCEGNTNNFESEDECMSTCGGKK